MSVKSRKEIILRKRPVQPVSTRHHENGEVLDHKAHNNVTGHLQPGEDVLTQRRFVDAVVQLAVSSNFGEKQSHCGDADPGQRGHRIFDLPPNLILNGENKYETK